jgi:hypothetical protein
MIRVTYCAPTANWRNYNMAKVIIEHAEVTRVFQSKGFWAETKFKTRTGDEVIEKWTVWTNDTPDEGDVVTIDGMLSIKMERFTNDQGEEIRYSRGHVNQPRITQEPKGAEAVAQVFDSEPMFDDEAPF